MSVAKPPVGAETAPKLADSPPLLAAAGDAIRIAQGREKWSTDNLPGRDVFAARSVLLLADAVIELRDAASRAESASLREQLATAEAELAKPENWPLSALNENNAQHAELVELRAKLRAALADAAALREQLGRVSNEVLRLTNQVAHLGMDLATAEALALTNGERVTRAEALLREQSHLRHRVFELERGRFKPCQCMNCEDIRAFLAPTEPDGASEAKETR